MMCPLASAAAITVLRGGAAMEKRERVTYIIEANSAHFPSANGSGKQIDNFAKKECRKD